MQNTNPHRAGYVPASWVIRLIATNEIVCEIFGYENFRRLNTVKYYAVPILEHLQSLNQEAQS